MNNKKRQRLPRIKPSIKQLISSQAVRYPDKPRQALAADVRDTIERMGEVAPSEETLIKMISDARNKEPNPLDNIWHMGTLNDYPLLMEAIPSVLKVQQLKVWLGEPFTVRQAQWVTKLFPIFKKTDLLEGVSWVYSQLERDCELSRTKFDTSLYDNYLLKIKSNNDAAIVFKDFLWPGGYPEDLIDEDARQRCLADDYAGYSWAVDYLILKDDRVMLPTTIKGTLVYKEFSHNSTEALRDLIGNKVVKSIDRREDGSIVVKMKSPIQVYIPSPNFSGHLHICVRKEGEK